jgi:hypothetical protein
LDLNAGENMTAYLWKLSREYLDALTLQRKAEALPKNLKKTFGSTGANSFPKFSIKT